MICDKRLSERVKGRVYKTVGSETSCYFAWHEGGNAEEKTEEAELEEREI